MIDTLPRLLNDESSQPQSAGSESPLPDETQALDAFSRVVIHVADLLRPRRVGESLRTRNS